MGLYNRRGSKMWWMSFVYRNKRFRKSTETMDRKEARKIYDMVKGQIAENRWLERLPGEGKTFKAMMEKYRDEHISQKASKRQYNGYVKSLLKFFGDSYATEIAPSMINDYKIKRRKDGVGPASINRELSTLKNAFNIALKQWGWMKENPVAMIAMEKEPPGRVRYLTDDEFERLHNACSDWLKPIVMVARHTGMRRGNILSLKWEQIDLFRKVILLDHTKNGERLGIPLNETMVELFKKLSKVRHIKSSYVFCRPDGERYVELKSSFQKALKEVGIENFRFHDLRHCFASALVQRGAGLYEVQRLLGHKSHAMTQRYAHLAPENLRNVVLMLDKGEAGKGSVTVQSQSQNERVSQAG